MSYADSVLVEGEVVLYRGRIHWAIYLSELFVTIVVLSSIIAIKQQPLHTQLKTAWRLDAPYILLPAYLIVCGAIIILIRDYIRMLTTELVITNSRVIAKFGVIRRVTYEILLSKVEGANIRVSILGRVLGYGSIEVKGIGGRTAPIPYVASPYLFQRNLMRRLLRNYDFQKPTEIQSFPSRSLNLLEFRGENVAKRK